MNKTWGNTHEPAAGNRLSVHVVGGLSVSRGGTLLTAQQLGGPKARQILEILLLQLGTPVSKGRLIDLLWGEDAPVAAVSTLESYISVLRRSLQPGMGKTGPLKTTSGGYYLDRELVDLDVSRFAALVREAERLAPVEAYPLLLEALALVDGPLLGNELSSEWAESERKFHAERVAAARLAAADIAARLGRTDEAVAWAQTVLAGDPLNETAWTELILALEQGGRPVEGLQAYERCRKVMDAELGCSPGPVLQEAQGRMLQATAGGEDEFGQVLSALLALHERVSGAGRAPAAGGGIEDNTTFQEAGSIVRRYLLRALTAA